MNVPDIRVKRVGIIGGIRREPGDFLVRDGEFTDGVTPEVIEEAIKADVIEVDDAMLDAIGALLVGDDDDSEGDDAGD